MQILAALFIEDIEVRPVPGPSTRIDLSGIGFSFPAPQPVPVTMEPHLVVLMRNPDDEPQMGALEVVYQRGGEQVARNVQPVEIEAGRFSFRLVRAELEFTGYDTVEAHCRVDMGPETIVPYTLLPPVD
ncbi:MAG: hypothetical protein HYX32_08900 [Actinobacteria bacterium]|nr:hypothetical protein [Actinomycetota bacterium]